MVQLGGQPGRLGLHELSRPSLLVGLLGAGPWTSVASAWFAPGRRPAGPRPSSPRHLTGADQQAHHHAEDGAGDESDDESGDHGSPPRGPEDPRSPAYRAGMTTPGTLGIHGAAELGARDRAGVHHGLDAPGGRSSGAGFAAGSSSSGGGALAAGSAGRQVTIVDQRNFHTFQPLLYEVATAGLDAGDVAYPIRADLRPVGQRDLPVRHGRPASTGSVGRSSSRAADPLPFDSLIVASGATGQVLRDPRGVGVQLPPLHAHRRPPTRVTMSCVDLEAGRRRSGLGADGCPDLRRGRRRAHRGRGGRRPGRAARRGRPPRRLPVRPVRGPDHRWSTDWTGC